MTSGQPTSTIARCDMLSGSRVRRTQRSALRKQRHRYRCYEVSNPNDFQLRKFASPDNLYNAYQILKEEGGHAPGIDGFDFSCFSDREVRDMLRTVSDQLLAGTYVPDPVRIVEFPKPNGKLRRLSLQTLADRTVAKALLLCVGGYLRRHLPRYGQSRCRIYAQMQRAIRTQQKYVIAPDDIENCFPTTRINIAMHSQRRHIVLPELLWLIETVIRGHEGPCHVIGLDQGSPFSPIAMECVLHHCLDVRLDAVCQGSTLFRYVDNLTFLCNSVREAEESLRISREILAECDFRLKGEEGAPQDLRSPECNKSILGLIPRWQSGKLEFSISEKSFDDLRKGLQNSIKQTQPVKASWWVMNGWINAYGPALTSRVAPHIVEQMMNMACHIGIREVSRRQLLETARNARSRWLEDANIF